ncbi:hypothetical protein MP228_002156 [Amoeboaphelidium protococcarum]|nr:hypothetical protein MP228_002156 [Amoeboaphelidium protococcarum]
MDVEQSESLAKKDEQYFGYYAQLANQQNMLQDGSRTETYKYVIENALAPRCIQGKSVMDIGAGSGVLSFFSLIGGADKVFAVEGSSMAQKLIKFIEHSTERRLNLPWLRPDKIRVLQDQVEQLIASDGKSQQLQLKHLIDTLVSEPIGVMLLHERMCESYVRARDYFLKKPQYDEASQSWSQMSFMIPSGGVIIMEPISDQILYNETLAKCRYWIDPAQSHLLPPQNYLPQQQIGSEPQMQYHQQQHTAASVGGKQIYGIDFSGFYEQAQDEAFGSPVVGPIAPYLIMSRHSYKQTHEPFVVTRDPSTFLNGVVENEDNTIKKQSKYNRHLVDFTRVKVEEMHKIEIPLRWEIAYSALLHGLASWFDLVFSDKPCVPPEYADKVPSAQQQPSVEILMSTSPFHPITHWQQLRLLFKEPLAVNKGDFVAGKLTMVVNEHRSYDLQAEIYVEDSVNGEIRRNSQRSGSWKLQDQTYNYNIAQYYPAQQQPQFQYQQYQDSSSYNATQQQQQSDGSTLNSANTQQQQQYVDDVTLAIDENGQIIDQSKRKYYQI